MEWLQNNWMTLIVAILIVLILVYGLMTGKAKEWLKYAVVEAEKELGTGTGQLKLREVYDMFVSKFPVFSKIVPFGVFSSWVDLALEWMENQLEKNANIKAYIEKTE